MHGYVDRAERNAPGVAARTDTLDALLQHTLRPMGRHQLIWGAGHRWIYDRFNSPFPVTLVPGDRDIRLGSVFLQDQVAFGDALGGVVQLRRRPD